MSSTARRRAYGQRTDQVHVARTVENGVLLCSAYCSCTSYGLRFASVHRFARWRRLGAHNRRVFLQSNLSLIRQAFGMSSDIRCYWHPIVVLGLVRLRVWLGAKGADQQDRS
ncbi:hypothetical protein AcV7_009499 [Taiwanofungus camphoratus]|nr:hypothetical protein AcV7_009499 [Antrodia cinnamomea]